VECYTCHKKDILAAIAPSTHGTNPEVKGEKLPLTIEVKLTKAHLLKKTHKLAPNIGCVVWLKKETM